MLQDSEKSDWTVSEALFVNDCAISSYVPYYISCLFRLPRIFCWIIGWVVFFKRMIIYCKLIYSFVQFSLQPGSLNKTVKEDIRIEQNRSNRTFREKEGFIKWKVPGWNVIFIKLGFFIHLQLIALKMIFKRAQRNSLMMFL